MSATPLLRLPVELLRNITDYLDLQDRVGLSMTSRYTWFTLPAPTHSELLIAEPSEWAVTKQLYTCKGCIRLRSLHHFADDMRKGARARSASDARSRFCLECGVERGWYYEGAKIAIYGKPAILSRLCSNLTDRSSPKAARGSQALTWVSYQKRKPSPYTDDGYCEWGDRWAHVPESYVETRHAEEEYGLWLDV